MPREEAGDEDCLRVLVGPRRADVERAFGVVFERHVDAVNTCAFRRTASWSAAEDITETVFLELWRQRDRVETHAGSLRPWLLGVAANLSRRWWRDQDRRSRAVARLARWESGGPSAADPAELVGPRLDDERRMAALLDAVRRLPAPQQDVLTLWAWDGLGYDEIAVALGLRVGTVKSRLNRARSALRGLEAPSTPAGTGTGTAADGTAPGLRASVVEPPEPGTGGVR